jgi:hypothetical protein
METFNEFLLKRTIQTMDRELETAVTLGDANRVREISDDIAKLKGMSAPATQTPKQWNYEDAKKAVVKIAPWFGKDPDKTKAAFEASTFIDPTQYNGDYDAYAKALVEAVDKGKPGDDDDGGGEDEDENGEDENGEEEVEDEPEAEPPPKPAKRKDEPARPAAAAGAAASARRSPGRPPVPTKFSQIPDRTQREKLQHMAQKQKLKEADVMKYWYEQEQKKKAAGKGR